MRVLTGNSLIGFATELTNVYDDHGHLKGLQHLSEQEEFYRQKLDYVQDALNQVHQEAGVDNEYWRDIENSRGKFDNLHNYIADIIHYAERATLQLAKRKRKLLYQKV